MDGSNTVLVCTASGVVKARKIKRFAARRTMDCQLVGRSTGSEITPNALEDDGGRVGIRAPVLQPHAAIPLPPLVPEFRQVRQAPLRWTDFEQFGYTDNCPGCANARAGRKQVVDQSAQCRSRMEAILMTTTEGHERLERARDRFCSGRQGTGEVEEPQRKRHRPEGEGRRREHLEVPQATDSSSSSSSSSESSTDTELGLVDVCTIISEPRPKVVVEVDR